MLSERAMRVLLKRYCARPRGWGDKGSALAKRQLYAALYGASLRKLHQMAKDAPAMDVTITGTKADYVIVDEFYDLTL